MASAQLPEVRGRRRYTTTRREGAAFPPRPEGGGLHAATVMIPPDDRASTGRCDADSKCLHVPCFQVQLDALRPRQAHRQANACAYHVPDVIETLQAWAGEHDVADGQLTILAIEPTADGRIPGQASQPGRNSRPGGPSQPELRGFAFSTIPLGSVQRRDPQASVGSRAAAPAERENQP